MLKAITDQARFHGPWEIAEALDTPSRDFRQIAYLFAHRVCEPQHVDRAIEAVVAGFYEWKAEHG